METERSERTRQWLAAHELNTEGDPDHVARAVMPEIRGDAELPDADKLELGLGLLELLDTYWVTVELRWFVNAAADEAIRDAHWQAIRKHLERPKPSEAVLYSLWVDWFEDIATVERAFTEVLARDVPALPDAGEELLRRAAAALKVSGPVPWKLKHAVYTAAAAVPRLRPAVFNGLLYSYHDMYGSLEIAPALELLDSLEMPEDTEHLAELRDELTHGHANRHHREDAPPPPPQ
ncbi:hypothetical protein AB0M46_07950 [Dactylosporangium sp. NPDC051485]|uniref:hypothetical protein n=1 Tax=Dactylosporangium sp. NPDC051485 TaxID=3154846 RepID=UPI00343DEC3C